MCKSVQLAIVSACDGYAREQARSTSSKKARDRVVSALLGRFVEAADGVSAFVTGPCVLNNLVSASCVYHIVLQMSALMLMLDIKLSTPQYSLSALALKNTLISSVDFMFTDSFDFYYEYKGGKLQVSRL